MFRAESKELLTQDLLLEGAKAFGITPGSLTLVGGFENIIYGGELKGSPVVLRITNHRHRSSEQLAVELHWLQYLQEHGANVCGPFKSQADNLVESLAVDGTWLHFSCFAKAPGKHIITREELHNVQLFQAWGRATGKLHRLTRDYSPPQHLPRREDNVDIFYNTLVHHLPPDEKLKNKVHQLAAFIQALPRTKEWYGLMHSDIHASNFFYDGQELHIFDFDDACYYQLASDGAMALYYSIWGSRLEGTAADEFGHRFLTHWLKGYLQEHSLSLAQLMTFPQLLLFRDCELLALLRDEFDLDNLAPEEDALLKKMTARIMSGSPCVQLDYERIWEEVKQAE